MALQRDTRPNYIGRWDAASTEQPQGAFRNRTTPGDGSYLDQDWANDWGGFFSSLLKAPTISNPSGVDANGNIDEVGASQYFDQLMDIIRDNGFSTGDFIVSRNDLTSRGFSRVNNLPFVHPGSSTFTGTFTEDTSYPGTVPRRIAINQRNGDVWVFDDPTTGNDIVYRLSGGSWSQVGTFPSQSVTDLAINDVTGDVYAVGATSNQVYRLPSGTTTWGVLKAEPSGAIQLTSVAVNPFNGDLYVIDQQGFGSDDRLYKLPGADGSREWSDLGDINNGSRSIVVDNARSQLYMANTSTNNIDRYLENPPTSSSFVAMPTVFNSSESIFRDTRNGDLYVGAGVPTGGAIYRLPGGYGSLDDWVEVAPPSPVLTNVADFSLNEINGDMWVVDLNGIYRSPGTIIQSAAYWWVRD